MATILETTSYEARAILTAAGNGDIQTLDKYVQQVSKSNDIRPGTVLFIVRSPQDGETALHKMVRSKGPVEYFAGRDGYLFGHQDAKATLRDTSHLFNQRDNEGRNAALHACRHDDPTYLASLVNMGSSLDYTDNHGWGALHWAARFDCPLLTKHLMNNHGFMPHQASDNGDTPIHIAAKFDALDAFKTLLSAKKHPSLRANYMMPNADGHSPIDMVFVYRSTNIRNYLRIGLGMGMARPVRGETERWVLRNMVRIWNKDRFGDFNICDIIEMWLNGIQDGVPQPWNRWESDDDEEYWSYRRDGWELRGAKIGH